MSLRQFLEDSSTAMENRGNNIEYPPSIARYWGLPIFLVENCNNGKEATDPIAVLGGSVEVVYEYLSINWPTNPGIVAQNYL